MNASHTVRLALTLALAFSASAASLHAQTPLTGSLSDTTTGALVAGVYTVTSNIDVPAGKTLNIAAGAILKFNGGLFTLNGTLNANGTALAPVVFTSIHDDTAGGDTNGNGAASAPAKGNWSGVLFNAGVTASTLKHARIRYAGSGGWAALTGNSPLLKVEGVRIEHSSSQGFLISTLSDPGFDWTAWDCDGGGVVLSGGSFTVKRIAAANNPGAGITRTGFAGTIRSANSFGNGGAGNVSGFLAGSVFHSNGSAALAGSNGNINSDPQFVNAAAGDFTLQKTSPCVDTGDSSDVGFSTEESR